MYRLHPVVEGVAMLPRTLIVCMSIHHQNTAKIAHVLANIFHADMCEPTEVTLQKLCQYDLIGFGSGIYYGRFHPVLRQKIAELPNHSMLNRKAFVFSTEGLPSLFWLWNWPMKSRLLKKGFQIVGEFHCSGFDTVGPLWLLGGLNRRHPDHQDLDHAAEFGRRLLDQLSKSPFPDSPVSSD